MAELPKDLKRRVEKKQRKRDREIDGETLAAVERDYRAGLLSVTEIGERYGMAQSTVSRYAALYHWERGDLSPDIAKTAEAILAREAAKEGRGGDLDAVIEDSAAVVADVMRDHRLLSKAARRIGVKLLRELEENADGDNLRDRAGIYQKLSGSLKTVVEMERLSFGIDKNSQDLSVSLPAIEVSFVKSGD